MEYTSPKSEVQTLLFSIIYIFVPAILLACVIAFRCPTWVRLLFFVWYTSHLLQGMSLRTGNSWVDYSNGSTLGGELTKTFYLLFLVNPALDWSHRSDAGKRIDGRPWWKRVYWCLCAAYTMRGVGWNYQVPGVPSPSKMNRYMFLGCTTLRVVTAYLLLDFAQYSMQATPFFNDPQTPNDSIRSLPYLQRVVCVATWFLGGYAGIRFYYFTVALVCVSLGVSDPQNWPEAFGSWKQAYSVRNFWGKTWHQFIRRFCVSPGRKLAEMVGVPPKSLAAASIQLYVAFFFSALMHSLGDYMVGRDYVGISFRFFCLQPFAITFEELVKIAALRLGLKDNLSKPSTLPVRGFISANASATVKRVVCYMWVVWWFTTTAPFLIDPAMQAGFHRELIFPRSPIRSVVKMLFSE
ncbi:membrane bound O-acyl transferase family-domain-containing protein [Lentinula edodes]|nr:membrane bound O-acyl transferase family-domain-containing protein [Lentinula edodes]